MAGMLKELLAKIEAATEGSSRLDYEICVALDHSSPPVPAEEYLGNVTRSIDSAVALVEKRRLHHQQHNGWSFAIMTEALADAWDGFIGRKMAGPDAGAWCDKLAIHVVTRLLRAELSTPEAGNG